MKGGVKLKKLEQLRALLYKAIESNKKDEVLKLSRELDKVVVKEMRAFNIKKTIKEERLIYNKV